MENASNVSFLGYTIFSGQLKDIELGDNVLVNTINQYSYCIAEKDIFFKEALQNSDVLLPDGIAIVHASKFLDGHTIKKIAGADIHHFLLHKLNKKNGSCFYFGASESTLLKIENKVKLEFPNIKFKAYSPPFKSEFSEEENLEMIGIINDFKPDVLFVGMTAPKQEKWAYQNKNNLNTGLICSIGAVFDFYSGTVERPGEIWRDNGLEWLGRLLKEPKRMWRRYMYYGAIFVVKVIKKKLV
ncbi:WecB/TagA/CpsF family glycosyltransferase [uncultured Maribacter sp.]|uniref:WecB/TagA/CpsF family glycosyltransferase n=1 Tax=uncultured Maribacter sp. TaxID=431308 RepID=UPI0026328131|nr:WecB/TagA/CpsF family glycosyltransferase [uncultured Maribacter sp.]